MTTPEVATTVEELLAQIHQVAKDGNYIFRGENKNYGKTTSNLYRYFKTIVGQAELQKKVNTSIDFNPIKKTLENQLENQFGKDALKVDFATIEKNLKENILDQLAQTTNYPLSIEGMQKEFILKDAQEYMDFENEIDTLAEVQHYGGSTNLIDFSYDLAVALFFACDGEPEEDGRLILLSANTKGVIAPKKNQNNRIVFQKSIFVQRDKGYIDENEIKKFIILKDIKSLLLAYVQNYFGIRTETIYGDLMGYIQNKERHSEAYKQFFVGVFYYDNKEFEEAIKCYTKAIKIKPNFADAYFNRGIVYDKEGNYDIAIADYTKAIELNPNYAKAYNNRGNSYSHKGEHDLAIADYNKAIALNPDALVYDNRGIAYHKKGNYDIAIADYTKAIEMDPNYARAYNNRGASYSHKGEHNRSIVDYNKAIELDPNNAEAYSNRGIAYNSKGDYVIALADLNKSIELNPNDARAYYNRSASYFGIGDYDRSIVECSTAIELNPNYAEAYANRGIIKRNLQKEGAKEDLETALQLAKKQKNKSLVADIQKKIDNPPFPPAAP